MILVRTPFRLSLGGGSTDLPAYYKEYGGFIFAVTINLYLYLGLNRPPTDDLIRVRYSSQSEEVKKIANLKHDLARAALKRIGFLKQIEISSMADVSGGTGLGSSASYLVSILNALHTLKGEKITNIQLAEEAFQIATKDLGLPDGKQDFYLASLGNFRVLNIEKNGGVLVRSPKISYKIVKEFEEKTLLFNTNISRSSVSILREQQKDINFKDKDKIYLKHKTKEIGMEILNVFENGDLDSFGLLMDKHWNLKMKMSNKMSTYKINKTYEDAKKLGVLGGKIIGAGGGGFFLVYCKDGSQSRVSELFKENGFKRIDYKVDLNGSQVIINKPRLDIL